MVIGKGLIMHKYIYCEEHNAYMYFLSSVHPIHVVLRGFVGEGLVQITV